MRWIVVCLSVLSTACAPAHLKSVGLSWGGREMPELFLGGWTGRHLVAFNDAVVEPGLTRRSELVPLVSQVASGPYAAAYVESAKLDASAAVHGLFCDTPMCLVVFERKGAGEYSGWGEAVAIFELPGGAEDAPIGRVWLAPRAIRPPGPQKWEAWCRSRAEPPRYVHPEGGAVYPARNDGTQGFALFGTPLAAEYKRGFWAPGPTTCDEDRARQREEPEPERPRIQIDPKLLQGG